jgi:O-antigen ligase
MRLSVPAPAQLVARVACALGLASLVVLTLVDRGATRMYASPWWLIYWLMHGAAATALFARAADPTRPMVLPPWRWLIALGVSGSVVLAAALQSPYRGQSILAAATPLAALAVFLLVYDWVQAEPIATDARLEMLARGLGGLLGATVLLSVGRWTTASFAQWSHGATWSTIMEARNGFPLGHTNYTAGLALLALAWCGLLAWRARGFVRGAWSGLAALALVALFTSGSRGGLLGLAAMAVVALWLARLGWRRVAVLGLVALGLLLLLVVANPRVRSLLHPPDPLAPPGESDVQRSAMLVAGWRMGGDRPLLGWGPGVTPWVYPRYRAGLAGGAENVLQLHSLPVQVWADAGGAGLLCFLGLGGLLIAAIWRGREDGREPQLPGAFQSLDMAAKPTGGTPVPHLPARPSGMGVPPMFSDCPQTGLQSLPAHAAVLALAGYGVFALTDFQFDVPVFAFVVAVCGACLAPGDGAVVSSRARGGLAAAVLVAVLAIALLGRRDPTTALNAEALGLAREPAQAGRAVALLRDSLARNPDQEIAHFNLGWLLLIDDPAAAERHFLAAARLVPDKGGVYFGLGLARLNHGDATGAAHAWALECLNDPLFLTSPWWRIEALAAQRGETRRQLEALWRQGEGRFPSDRWLGRETRYIAALARWLSGEIPAAAVAMVATTDERRRFFSGPVSPPAGTPGAVRSYRRERTGYPVLMKNLDVPPPVDLFDVQEDPRMADSLRFLFPRKGWWPSPLLRELLDTPPAAPAR